MDCIGSCWWKKKRKRKTRQRRKKNIILSLGFCERGGRCFLLWKCQDVCHPDFIHLCAISLFFFFFFPPRSHIHTHIHTHRECILKCCWLGVETLAMGEAPVRLGNLRLFVLKANLVNNGGGCSGEGGSVGGEGRWLWAQEKWSPSSRGWRLGRLKEIFMSVIWRETKQLIGHRHRSWSLQRQLIHLLLLLFVYPVSWIWLKSDCYCRVTLCMYTFKFHKLFLWYGLIEFRQFVLKYKISYVFLFFFLVICPLSAPAGSI